MEKSDDFLEVAVVTTSGSYPESGFNRISRNQKIRIELDKAKEKLTITNTAGWIASADNKEVNIDKTYLEEGLSGKVTIDWGPRRSGGGLTR